VLDGNVIATPQTAGPIPGGVIQITGDYTRVQAEELAADVQSGALPADFRVSAISTFTPSASSQAAAA
jgi:preprotein translocase subunit SecD